MRRDEQTFAAGLNQPQNLMMPLLDHRFAHDPCALQINLTSQLETSAIESSPNCTTTGGQSLHDAFEELGEILTRRETRFFQLRDLFGQCTYLPLGLFTSGLIAHNCFPLIPTSTSPGLRRNWN